MYKAADTSSFGFLDTMLQYYLPGLNISSLTDEQYCMKIAMLTKIRELEKNSVNEQ